MSNIIELFGMWILGFITALIILVIIFLVIKSRKHPLYHKVKEKEDKERREAIQQIVHDTVTDYTSEEDYYDKIDKILEKHLSPEAIERTVLEVTEQLKKEGKISKDFSWDKVKKKGEENEV